MRFGAIFIWPGLARLPQGYSRHAFIARCRGVCVYNPGSLFETPLPMQYESIAGPDQEIDLYQQLEQRLSAIVQSGQQARLNESRMGLEKESLRVARLWQYCANAASRSRWVPP